MVAKEFHELRRDRRTVAMMIVLPVVLLVVFGYAANPGGAFALLDANDFAVQVQGAALRVAGPAAVVAGLISRAGIDATIEVVPANLEEAFVAIAGRPEAG